MMITQQVSMYQSVMANRQQRYNAAIASGHFEPFIYPWDAVPGLVLFLSLLFVPRLPKPYRRITFLIAYSVIVCLCTATLRRTRTLNFAGGYGTGLMCAWGMIMTVSLTLANDPGEDMRRIERVDLQKKGARREERHEKQANGSVATSTDLSDGASGPKSRKFWSLRGPALSQPQADESKPAVPPYGLIWQGHPTQIGHRIDWVCDLVTSFRGPNWNWRISSMPPIDVVIPEKSGKQAAPPTSEPTTVSTSTLHSLQRQAIIDFILRYILLDILKTVMITDPYFLGLAPLSSPTPWTWLSKLDAIIPIATYLTRLGVSLTSVLSALSFVFTLSPVFFTVVLPNLIDTTTLTRAPLLEPWMYPPYNSRPTTSVLDSGLPGFWGKFWHQLFRFGISEPSRYLIKQLHISPKGVPARILQIIIAFTLTGFIHACASYTTFSPDPTHNPPRPLTGSFTFFFLQGLAVLAQSFFSRFFSAYVSDVCTWPRALRRTLNGVFVLAWLYATGPLLIDDFARCGVWLFEPVPISFFRGLGLGNGDGTWWCWAVTPGEKWLGLWRDERWWRNGIAIY